MAEHEFESGEETIGKPQDRSGNLTQPSRSNRRVTVVHDGRLRPRRFPR